MFENIGKKIKGLAKCIAWAGIICSIIEGIGIINRSSLLIGLVAIIIGCLGFWISSFILYGFGELVQNSSIIAENIDNNRRNTSCFCAENDAINMDKIENETLELNNEINYINIKCPNCNEELSFPENTKTAVCPWCNTSIKP